MIRSKFLKPLILLLFLASYLIAWVLYVDPLADKDAILQIYFPLLNYLKGAQLVGLDHNFLVSEFFSDAYPDGIALFAWFISFLGLGSLFLENPYLFLIFLLIPCLIAIRPQSLTDRKTLLILIIFFLPGTQIALKGFSPHGFNLLYSLAGIISYLNYHRSGYIRWFVLALLFSWLSMSFKHMGMLHYFSFLAAHFLWQWSGEKKSFWENLLLWALPLTALPMYPLEKSFEYIKTTFSHAPSISFSSIALMGTGLIIGVLLLGKITRWLKPGFRVTYTKKPCAWFESSLIMWCSVLLPFWLWSYPSSEDLSLWFGMGILLVGYSLILTVFLLFNNQQTRGFLVLLTLVVSTHHTALYVSWIAKSSYLFFLPQILITWLWFLHRPRKTHVKIVLLGLVVLSNFFPTIGFFEAQKSLQDYASIYFEGFKSIHQNPLGWQRTNVLQIRDQMAKVLSSANLQDGSIAVAPHLHFHTRLSLVYPKNILFNFGQIRYLDELDSNQTLEWLESWRRDERAFFQSLLENAKIPILILGQDPFTKRTSEQVSPEEADSQAEFLPNRFLQAIGDAYLEYVTTNNYLTEFYYPTLKADKYKVSIWIHRAGLKLAPVTPAQERWRRGIDWEVDEDTIKRQEITKLFLESNSHFDTDPEKCLELLNKVLEMDPEHQGASEDRLLILQRLQPKEPKE